MATAVGERALDIASVAFLYWPADEDTRPAVEAGMRWQLEIEQGADERLEWSLEALPMTIMSTIEDDGEPQWRRSINS